MNRTLIAGIALGALGIAYAETVIMDKGDWPGTWPKELEPLRKQSRTLDGPVPGNRHYAITFTKREEFEAAWPHILKVKAKGAPVTLVRGPNFFLGDRAKAGVVIHCPPAYDALAAGPRHETPIEEVTGKGRGWNATDIGLVVDGEIVDLNRIPLPADTPIVDERFKEAKGK